ncbi:MAG: hypothetical protein A2Y61_05370 [Chloroflexi bacterium RBG_13_60_13]|nr:MAG: hypothetical protein A2Y61_05370 [Chloroflexi bacterium RBG_13_60_13]
MSWHFFHKWSNWEQYLQQSETTYTGFLYPKELRGKSFTCSEWRQKRRCLICGYMEDEAIQ